MKKIELLAPATSFEGLKAVINAGADAVYLGGQRFGARAYATNFDEEKLIEGIRYAHIHGVKVHLTLNTLVKESEMEDVYNFVYPYIMAGLDAIIVQDIGVISMLRSHFPNLEIHMSTQTTITSSECIHIVKKYNVKRIVLARELSIEEVEEIKRSTGVEVEVFVHGALCYSYSGQCLFSSMIGDRSGNRGRCAQPCRKMYKLYQKNEVVSKASYILSPKDMCGLMNVHNLINIGVDSLKIEGRNKSIEYAATIVSVYRKYIDLYQELGYSEFLKYYKSHINEIESDIVKMQDVYNRGGFNEGYFNEYNGKNFMATNLPSHQGVCVGMVRKVNPANVEIIYTKDVNAQDVLIIRDESYGEKYDSYEFTLKEGYKEGEKNFANYKKGLNLYVGQKVYRIRNNSLLKNIQEKYINVDKKKHIILNIVLRKNNCICIKVRLNEKEFEYKYGKVLEAINRPITRENVENQFKKMANTPFVVEDIKIEMDEDIFVPLKNLNEYRRQMVEDLIRDNSYRKEEVLEYTDIKKVLDNCDKQLGIDRKQDNTYNKRGIAYKCGILAMDMSQVNAILEYKEIQRIYLELDAFKKEELEKCIGIIKLNNKDIYIALPRLMRSKDIDCVLENYRNIFMNTSIDGYLVRNIESLNIIKSMTLRSNLDIEADSNLYVMNNYAKFAWQGQGIKKCTVSVELTKEEMGEIDKKDMSMIVYGKTPVMVSANCVKKTVDLCNLRPEKLILEDSYKEGYVVRTVCNYCYNVIYNSKPIDLIDEVKISDDFERYRIEFIDEDKEKVKGVLDKLCGRGKLNSNPYTGHYKKKTL